MARRRSWKASRAIIVCALVTPLELFLNSASLASDESARFQPLFGLEVKSKTLGWAGIELGMSLVQVERRVGTAIALQEVASASCGPWRTRFDRDGISVEVGLETAKPSAKVVWMRVSFEGYQIVARAPDLVRDLRQRAPEARYRPRSEFGPNDPNEDPAPVFELERAGKRFVIELLPREGLTIRLEPCHSTRSS